MKGFPGQIVSFLKPENKTSLALIKCSPVVSVLVYFLSTQSKIYFWPHDK